MWELLIPVGLALLVCLMMYIFAEMLCQSLAGSTQPSENNNIKSKYRIIVDNGYVGIVSRNNANIFGRHYRYHCHALKLGKNLSENAGWELIVKKSNDKNGA